MNGTQRRGNHANGMSRREFVGSLGTAGMMLGGAAASHAEGRSDVRRPLNVVIIITDDNDAESLGCFGCPLPGVTPNMDRLASEGVRFEHAHTVSPTCQPSRLALMTGRYPQNNGNTGHIDPLKPGVATLSRELKKAGYFTALVGKETNYAPYEAFAWDRHNLTADSWDDARDGYWSMWRSPEGFYRGTKELLGEARALGKPAFLHLNTSDPHRPWPGSVDEVAMLQRYEKDWGRKALRPYPRNFSPMEVPLPGYLPDLPGVRVDVAQYFSALHNADRAVGRIRDALEESGALEDTIVICFADQGAPLPPSKQNLYRFSTRIPLIVRWPEVTEPGHVVSELLAIIDLMPTLLEGLGLPAVEGVDGRSIFPLLRGESSGGREVILSSYNYAYPGVQAFPMRAALSKDFLYIYNAWPGERNVVPPMPLLYDGHIDPLTGLCWKSMKEAAKTDPAIAARVDFIKNRIREEFYDLREDPWCLRNLIDGPEHAGRIVEMRAMVENQMAVTGDPLLAKFRGAGPIPPEWLMLKQ